MSCKGIQRVQEETELSEKNHIISQCADIAEQGSLPELR